eukprot:6333389-Pyramimonas_sp.AAC.1
MMRGVRVDRENLGVGDLEGVLLDAFRLPESRLRDGLVNELLGQFNLLLRACDVHRAHLVPSIEGTVLFHLGSRSSMRLHAQQDPQRFVKQHASMLSKTY